MHRIDTSSAVAVLPAPKPQGTSGYWSEGDPTVGQYATIADQDWFNAVQEEIAHVVEQAHLTLNKADQTQLYQAIQYLISGGVGGFATQAWVLAQGYATQAWVSANFATPAYADNSAANALAQAKAWVNQQGFATQVWVNSQGFATQAWVQSWVNSQGYATTSWVNSQGYATTSWVNANYASYNWVEANLPVRYDGNQANWYGGFEMRWMQFTTSAVPHTQAWWTPFTTQCLLAVASVAGGTAGQFTVMTDGWDKNGVTVTTRLNGTDSSQITVNVISVGN
jgi:hypothetical protein